MAVTKTKMSKSAWVLVALIIVAIISLPILHIVGVIDLSFLGEGFMGIMTWASTEALNGALLLAGVFVGGMLTYYTLKKYFIGTKIPLTTQYPTYTPGGQTVSQPQQADEETVVS